MCFGPERRGENIEDFSQLFDCPHHNVRSVFERDAGTNSIIVKFVDFGFRKVFSRNIGGRKSGRVER